MWNVDSVLATENEFGLQNVFGGFRMSSEVFGLQNVDSVLARK